MDTRTKGVHLYSIPEISLTATFYPTPCGKSAISLSDLPRRDQRLTGEEVRFLGHLLNQIVADAARGFKGEHVYPQEGL